MNQSTDRIVVVSTERDAGDQARACILSVARQVEDHTHIFIDDGSQEYTRSLIYSVVEEALSGWVRDKKTITIRSFKREDNRYALQNLWEVVDALDPSTIVVWLDGDDHLAHPAVLSVVRRLYEDDPELWLTWGQFIYADGRPGWAYDYEADIRALRAYRNHLWRATHLKTFRAGLFQKILQQDLKRKVLRDWPYPGAETKDDEHFTYEWIERCTDLAVMFPMLEMAGYHGKFVPLNLCVYSGSHTPEGPGTESWKEAQRIRALPKYRLLDERPW